MFSNNALNIFLYLRILKWSFGRREETKGERFPGLS